MTNRTVEVLLRLITDQYKRSAREAADATDHLDRSVDDLSDSVKDADQELKKLPADAAKAGAALKTVGRDADSAAKETEQLSHSVKDVDQELKKIPPDAARAAAAMKLLGGDANAVGERVASIGDKSTGLAILDVKIRETRAEVRKLGEEFVRTGDVDVFKKLGDADGRLRGLESVQKKLKDALVIQPQEARGFFKRLTDVAQQAGQDAGKLFSGGLTGVLSTPVLGPIIATALLAAVGAASTLVLAGAGGLILGAAGAGAVGLGIVGAIMGDPKAVGGAWTAEIDQLKEEWLAASTVFRSPLIDGAHEFGGALNSIDLDETLAKAASYMPGLTRGAAGLTRELGGTLRIAVNDAGPAMQVIGDELPKIGFAIKQAMAAIAVGGEGGAQALKDVIQFTERLIVTIGFLISFAEQGYGALAKFRDFVLPRDWFFTPDAEQRLLNGARSLGKVGDSALLSADDLKALSTQLNTTAITADSLAAAMVGKIFTATMGLDQALLGVYESLTRLDQTFEKNGKAIDKHTGLVAMNTEKGQANREAVLAAVTANMQLYQAQIAAGMTAEDAAKNYDSNTASLEGNLRKAKLTTAQIDDLIGKYRGIPANVDRDIAINGLTAAINGLTDLIKLINGIHDKTVTVTVKQVGDNPRGQSRGGNWAHGGIRRAAIGMLVPPSDPGTVLMGEPQTGGEALIPLRGITQARAMNLAGVVGQAHGFDVVPRDYRGYRAHTPSPGMWAGAAAASAAHTAGGAARATAAADSQGQARAIRAALDGMSVVLDGVKVGQVMGRQADLLQRGG